MTNPNDLAFSTDALHEYTRGLTKREYFAAQAMRGVATWDALINDERHNAGKLDVLAKACVSFADALIAELNK